ncbi:MAG: hypothetical protein NXH75_13930 [Halobacteriovoraceae bacterium]|nr:hypothetical protein [Halobacteriovoraceae bacterium]
MKYLALALALTFSTFTQASDLKEDLTCSFKMATATGEIQDLAIKFVATEGALYMASEGEDEDAPRVWDIFRNEFSFKKVSDFPYVTYLGVISGGAAGLPQNLTITMKYPMYNWEDKKTYQVLGVLFPSTSAPGFCETESLPAK